MSSEKLKIGIDVDGVMLDYMVTVRAYAEMYDFIELNKKELIDDSPEVCSDAIKNGFIALYFREKDSPKLEENNNLYDIDNWGQIYRYINEIANQKKEKGE